MAAKPVTVPRERAHLDVDEAIAWYMAEAGADTAFAFVAAIEKAYAAIADRPGIGSPRYAHESDLPGLGTERWRGFRCLLYVERDNHIDVWRVLDGRRDIPAHEGAGLANSGPHGSSAITATAWAR